MQKIGLVLSGGLAKGAYQFGVIKAINELINYDSITAISASSVGILNAYAYINHELDTAEKIWQSVNCKNMTQFIRNVLQSDFLDEQIKKIPPCSNLQEKDFYITLLNATDKSIDYVNLKDTDPELIEKFIRAGITLPPFNKPYRIMTTEYFDGALVDNIPISPLVTTDLDCIICIYFDNYNYNFENNFINRKTIKINQQSDMFMKNVFLFKHEYIEKMIDDGYYYGKNVLRSFFENGELVANYKEKIDEFNRKNSELKWYVTCEVLTKKLNKITQKYLNRKNNQ